MKLEIFTVKVNHQIHEYQVISISGIKYSYQTINTKTGGLILFNKSLNY